MFQHSGLFRVRLLAIWLVLCLVLRHVSAEAEMRGDGEHQMFYVVHRLFGGVLIFILLREGVVGGGVFFSRFSIFISMTNGRYFSFSRARSGGLSVIVG